MKSQSLPEEIYKMRRDCLQWKNPHIPADDYPGADHLIVHGHDHQVLGVVSYAPIPFYMEDEPEPLNAMRFFGFAVCPSERGTGIGSLIMQELHERVQSHGVIDIMWANARLSAVPFYHKHGFMSVGKVFTDPITGLNDLRIVRQM